MPAGSLAGAGQFIRTWFKPRCVGGPRREGGGIAEPYIDLIGLPSATALGEFMLIRKRPGLNFAIEGGPAKAGDAENFIEPHEPIGGLKHHGKLPHLIG